MDMQASSARLLYPLRGRLREPLRSALPRYLNPRRLRHIVPDLSTDDFIAVLNQRAIDYVVLNLPILDEAKIELLIADADLEGVEDLVTEWPVGTPIRIYTVSARTCAAYYSPLVERAVYNRMAVFPPYISEQLLRRAVPGPGGMKVLDARDAFFACAYRAAYMEAGCCDWRDAASRCERSVAYESELRRLSELAAIDLPEPPSPQSLDRLLHAHGWRPPADLLERAAKWSPWINAAFPELVADRESDEPGLAAFFIRERAIQDGWKPRILETLVEHGFELMIVEDLDEAARERAERGFRGGNWGPARTAVSGGAPACLVIGLDVLPVPVRVQDRAKRPGFDNQKNLTAKRAVRERVNAALAEWENYNPIHGTDHSRQAWFAVRQLIPEQEAELHRLIKERRKAFAMNGVVHVFPGQGLRAKVELIDLDGRRAVRKTFRPSALSFMQREIDVFRELGEVCPEIPKLLGRGANYFVTEYVEEDVEHPAWPRPLSFAAVRQLSGFVKRCVAHGFDPVDLKPGSDVLLTRSGIRVIDYEFWRRCAPRTPLDRCFGLAGVPRDDPGDRPTGADYLDDPYRRQWLAWTALPLDSFLYDPAWLQRCKRSVHLAVRYGRWLGHEMPRRMVPRRFRESVWRAIKRR